jgi:hypothetical protein
MIERRRLALLLGEGDVDAVLAALDAYRNRDGGYGWGIEPDLRSPESQPTGAMHTLGEGGLAAETDARAVTLRERLARLLPPDGVVPVSGGAPDEALRPLDLAPLDGSA